ncbi:hypothetical protein EWM64_g632 [Hericium alpestre]|uniref:tRNA-binding domain-containing protein n=1 Tax=Hericium alpestre TaxID=135208 RepID=A0A4Z0ABJ6_9AGAM|nr:hypothetical protein EWM64_g632 [Hericium alpestre]
MSTQAAIAKLQSDVRALVEGAAKAGPLEFGKSEKEKAQVSGWIEQVAKGDVGKAEGLKDLDAKLLPLTYVVSNYLSAADVALYGALHPIYSQLQPAQYYAYPAVTRYFDHIQSAAPVRKSADALSPAFAPVSIDLSNAPPIERKEPEKKAKATPASTPAPAKEQKSEAAPAPVEKAEKAKKGKKEENGAEADAAKSKPKKEKKGGEPKKADKAAAAEESSEPIPSMIDLRVGHIIKAERHPDADGLYIEQIDFGEETGPRTVISGLANYIPLEQMQDRWLVGVCNLKPANMRGVKSFAMVLCATASDGKDAGLEIVNPPPNSKPGERVYFEGAEFEGMSPCKAPLPQLNPKKKIFEAIQPGFTTLENKEAAWINPVTKSVHRLRTKDGILSAPTLVGASLS